MLIALADRECLELADVMDFRETSDPLARERETIGADHCALGAWFAELSNLPAPLVEVIRYHHAPERAKEVPRLIALVSAADHIANYLHCGLAPASYDLSANAGLRCLTETWSVGRRDRLRRAIPELMQIAAATPELDLH
jgi:hypothetical protein